MGCCYVQFRTASTVQRSDFHKKRDLNEFSLKFQRTLIDYINAVPVDIFLGGFATIGKLVIGTVKSIESTGKFGSW